MPSLPRKPKVNLAITERDYKVLKYLWKWKALSTCAIAKKFFKDIQPLSTYRRLLYLEKAGFLDSVEVEGRDQDVWCLAAKGFKHIRPKMGELKHEGYKSENYHHDYLTTAFHLGEWLTGQPEYTQTYSEQQLRRIPEDLWADWVPQSTLHRPDGYSMYFSKQSKVVAAFEVELSIKSQTRYESVVTFYDNQPSISIVFWLIESKGMLNSLRHAFEKYGVTQWSKHQFILLSDFRKDGWQAQFIEGQYKGKSLSDLIFHFNVTQASLWHHCSDVLALLDVQKKPTNTSHSPIFKKSKISD